MSDYFSTLGKAVQAELSKNPALRQRFKQLANSALIRHLNGPMARDQSPGEMPPRGAGQEGQYQNGNGTGNPGDIDSDDCITFLQMLLQRLGPDEHEALIAKLGALIEEAHNAGGSGGDGTMPNNNEAALDRNKRSARDNSMMPRPNTGLDKRRTAQDTAFAVRALNAKSFATRFPDAGKITVLG